MSIRYRLLAALVLTGCTPGTGDKPADTGEPEAPVDADGDGYAVDVDCNDANAAIHPDAAEICDPGDVDEDCDGLADSADPGLTDGTPAHHDGDGDGYGDAGETVSVCEVGAGYVEDGTDCDDHAGDVHPGATEVCDPDDVDEDCSGAADDADAGVTGTSTFYADADGDGLGDARAALAACDEAEGIVSDATDCDDTSAAVAGPTPWYGDADADGYGDASVRADACAPPAAYVADATDCDDDDAAVHPSAAETCALGDEDCDGLEDDADPSLDRSTATTWYADTDGDGLGAVGAAAAACVAPGGYVADATDCDDTSIAVGGPTAWYRDADGDGFGDPAVPVDACAAPADYLADATDCDDANAAQPDALGNCAVPYTTAYGSTMVVIEPGTFTMGGGTADAAGDYADHVVTLTHTFWLGEHEVTQDEWGAWSAAPDATPSYFTGGDLPVEQVSWEDVARYANALSAAEGLTECYASDGSDLAAAYASDPYGCPGYRLPTEAEWEYAARAAEDTTYAGSNTLGDVAWSSENAGSTTHEGCTLDPNAWGLCDMSGNVWEWTNDWYDESYGGYGTGASSLDPAGPSSGTYRVFRGASWDRAAEYQSVAFRTARLPDYTYRVVGFRLARSSLSP